MKYRLWLVLRKIIAALTSFIMTLTGAGTVENPDPVRPDGNTVEAYNEESADYRLGIDASDEMYDISDLLFGAFFEDINFAADGGLYAEKVVNRSFEYTELAAGNQLYGWSSVGSAAAQVRINDTENCLNENNTNYLVLTNDGDTLAGTENKGFLEGMAVEKDAKYNLSVYAKSAEGYTGSITVRIRHGEDILAEGKIDKITSEWEKYELSFVSSETATENVYLQVLIGKGTAELDMVSLFPEDTYKGRENGLRKDLCEMLEEMQPKFLRFPGGCVIEGYDYDTAYNWKDSLAVGSDGKPLYFDGSYGNVAARSQGINIWTDTAATDDPYPCFMSYGLGFYEFFQLSEDIGAVGVPVLNCGLNCQMRGKGPVDMESDEFRAYLQDMLDLVEFCRGDASTTWGKVRVSLGHPEPFELQYICIGNENEGEDYYERYQAFVDEFNEAKAENPELYEGIELIYSAGASDATHGTNYIKSYEYAEKSVNENGYSSISEFAGAIDQHYYNTPEWFLENTDYYDSDDYKRDIKDITATRYGGSIGVFLGEYAAKSNTLRSALAEAAYMTGLERNGDIVKMAAYAPLFGNLTATHWSPDLIWFNNHQVTGSINYYIQKLFSTNQGSTLLSSSLDGALIDQTPLSGRVGVGTWYTSAEFDNVKVVSNETGKVLDKDNFSIQNFSWNWDKATDGKWRIKGGKLVNTTTSMNYSNTGSVCYFGTDDWTDYTYTVDATKLEGGEGFIIPFAVSDKDNCFFWNIGGFGNTVSCIQQITDGEKTGQIPGTIKDITIEEGKTYSLKVVVSGTNVKCYIDNELYVDYNTASDCEAEAYQVVSTDETGDVIIKLVNVTGKNKTFAVNVDNAEIESTATVYQVAGDSLANDNILGAEEDCTMKEYTLNGFSDSFNYTAPAYSATVIRLKTK